MTKKVLLEGLGGQYWEILMEASCPPVRVVNPIPKRDLMWREKGWNRIFDTNSVKEIIFQGFRFLRFVINKNNTNIQIIGLQTAFFCRIKSMAKYDLYEISGQIFMIYMKSMTRKLLKS